MAGKKGNINLNFVNWKRGCPKILAGGSALAEAPALPTQRDLAGVWVFGGAISFGEGSEGEFGLPRHVGVAAAEAGVEDFDHAGLAMSKSSWEALRQGRS